MLKKGKSLGPDKITVEMSKAMGVEEKEILEQIYKEKKPQSNFTIQPIRIF